MKSFPIRFLLFNSMIINMPHAIAMVALTATNPVYRAAYKSLETIL